MCFKCILNIGGTPQLEVYRNPALEGLFIPLHRLLPYHISLQVQLDTRFSPTL